MDLSTALAIAPYAKKAWKALPSQLKLPLVAASLLYLWWRRRDDAASPAEAPADDGDVATAEA